MKTIIRILRIFPVLVLTSRMLRIIIRIREWLLKTFNRIADIRRKFFGSENLEISER